MKFKVVETISLYGEIPKALNDEMFWSDVWENCVIRLNSKQTRGGGDSDVFCNILWKYSKNRISGKYSLERANCKHVPAVTCSESPLLSRIKLAGPVHPEQQLLPAKDSGLQNLNKIPRS